MLPSLSGTHRGANLLGQVVPLHPPPWGPQTVFSKPPSQHSAALTLEWPTGGLPPWGCDGPVSPLSPRALLSGDPPYDIAFFSPSFPGACPSWDPARRTSTMSPTWSSTRSDPKSSVPSSTTGGPFSLSRPLAGDTVLEGAFCPCHVSQPPLLRVGPCTDAEKKRQLCWVGSLGPGTGQTVRDLLLGDFGQLTQSL